MVAFRSFCYFGLVVFLPYQQQNISLIAGSHYLSLMLFAGAVGGLIGGYISDIIGRKPVIVDSLILATVPFLIEKYFYSEIPASSTRD
jgi:FSR family fosmidomycin resistance protein-like MFS transporter